MSQTKITVQSTINADVKKVWDNYTQPQHITRWNFAVDDWECPSAENDMRVGGKYKARMQARDGSFGFDFEATYDEVTPYKSFSYTMPDGRRVDTTFEDLGGRTEIATTFDAEDQNPIEMQRGGWQAILDNFRKYTESSAANG